MKILLVQPRKAELSMGGEDVFIFEPLAMEYVAGGISKENDVRILDMRFGENLESVLREFQPQVVGITSYTVHVNPVKKLFQQVKDWNTDTLTVVGGHHATILPEDFHLPYIDLVVMGEGVIAFREIINRYEKGETFENIPGVAFDVDGKQVKTEYVQKVDLDALPLPDRSLTARYRKRYYSEWMKPLASIRTSKGCPFRCRFCALWKLTGGYYLTRSPKKIVEELTIIDEEYVFFADDESLVDARRMKELAELIKKAGINKKYFLYGRSDTISKNPELLKIWRDIGLVKVFVGLEFFRNDDLDYVGKKTSIDDNKKAIGILNDLGIQPYPSLIIRPEWSKEDFRAMKQYCKSLGLPLASFAVLTPLPGTDLFEETKESLITHNYDLFDFLHTVLPTSLPLKEFFNQYYLLHSRIASPADTISNLKKYPLKEIPGLFLMLIRFYMRLKRAHLDYGTNV